MQHSDIRMQTMVAGVALCLHVAAAAPSAQQLLDRVLVRVDGAIITQSDVRAAMALGVVETRDDLAAATQQLVDRQLLLAEVARFPPPDPADADVEAEIDVMRAHAGNDLARVMETTGVDAARLREIGRDTLRIRAYLRQRFSDAAQPSSPEVRQWQRELRSRAEVVMVNR